MENISLIALSLGLALVTEHFTEIAKQLYQPLIKALAKRLKVNIDPAVFTPIFATAIAIALAIGAEVNILSVAGVDSVIGTIVTGFAIGRGSNFIQELYTLIRGD